MSPLNGFGDYYYLSSDISGKGQQFIKVKLTTSSVLYNFRCREYMFLFFVNMINFVTNVCWLLLNLLLFLSILFASKKQTNII